MGYYLDNNIYKKCYYTCKECQKPGNNITHNCTICIDNYTSILNNDNYFNCYPPNEQIGESININYNTSIPMTQDKNINSITPITIFPSTDEIIPSTSMTINYSINSSYIHQQCKITIYVH